eukprot:scaffold27484_cov120-Isochrysis_galbana.AAC.9
MEATGPCRSLGPVSLDRASLARHLPGLRHTSRNCLRHHTLSFVRRPLRSLPSQSGGPGSPSSSCRLGASAMTSKMKPPTADRGGVGRMPKGRAGH